MPALFHRTSLAPVLIGCFLALSACSAPPPERPAIPRTREEAAGTAALSGESPKTAPPQARQEETDLRPDEKKAPHTVWADATIPAGTSLVARLPQRLSSDATASGTVVRAVIDDPLRLGDREVLPSGSTVEGFVGQVIPAAEGAKGGGSIALRFRLLRTPVGTAAPAKLRISAVEAAKGKTGTIAVAGPESVAEGVSGGTVITAGRQGAELVLDAGTRLTLVVSEDVPIKVRP